MELKLSFKEKQEAYVIISQIAKVNVSGSAPPPLPLLPVQLLYFKMERGVSSIRSRLLVYVIQKWSQLTFYLLDRDVVEADTMTVIHLMGRRRLLTCQSHHCTGSPVITDEQHHATWMCRMLFTHCMDKDE